MPFDLFHKAEAEAQYEGRRAELARLHRITRARLLWQMQTLAKAERAENACSPHDDKMWRVAQKYADQLRVVEYSRQVLDNMEESEIFSDLPSIELIANPSPEAPNSAFFFKKCSEAVGFLFIMFKSVFFPLIGTLAAIAYLSGLSTQNQWPIAVILISAAGAFVLGYVVFAVAGRILDRINSPLAPSDPRHPAHFEWANRRGRYADDA